MADLAHLRALAAHIESLDSGSKDSREINAAVEEIETLRGDLEKRVADLESIVGKMQIQNLRF